MCRGGFRFVGANRTGFAPSATSRGRFGLLFGAVRTGFRPSAAARGMRPRHGDSAHAEQTGDADACQHLLEFLLVHALPSFDEIDVY